MEPLKAKMVGGALWSSGGSIAVKVVGIAASLIIIKALTVHEYGVYQLALAAYGIVFSLFLSGFDQVALAEIMRAKSEKDTERMHRLFNEFTVLKIAAGIFLFLVLFLGARAAGIWYEAEIAPLLRILAFLIPVVALERVLNMIFSVHLSFRAISLFPFAEELAKFVFLVLFLFVFGYGLFGVVLAAVLGTATALLVFLPLGFRLYHPHISYGFTLNHSGLTSLFLSHGKWAVGARYLNDFQRNIRPWLIKTFLSTEAVGIFSLALNLYGQAVSLFSIANVLNPVAAQEARNPDRIKKLLLISLKYGTIFFIIVGGLTAVFVPMLVTYLFPQYAASIPLFWALLVTLGTTSAAFMLSSLFYGYREQRSGFVIMIFGVLFTLAAGPVLLRLFGVWGMVIEFVAGAYLFNILRLRYIFRNYPELRVYMSDLFSWTAEDKQFLKSTFETALQSIRLK